MTGSQSISEHWGTGDVYARIIKAMEAVSIAPDAVTVEQLAPFDHFHARGFPVTTELADVLPIQAGHHTVDIGCGIGGPARYLAKRFGCRVSGVDITQPFIEAANKAYRALEDNSRALRRERFPFFTRLGSPTRSSFALLMGAKRM